MHRIVLAPLTDASPLPHSAKVITTCKCSLRIMFFCSFFRSERTTMQPSEHVNKSRQTAPSDVRGRNAVIPVCSTFDDTVADVTETINGSSGNISSSTQTLKLNHSTTRNHQKVPQPSAVLKHGQS